MTDKYQKWNMYLRTVMLSADNNLRPRISHLSVLDRIASAFFIQEDIQKPVGELHKIGVFTSEQSSCHWQQSEAQDFAPLRDRITSDFFVKFFFYFTYSQFAHKGLTKFWNKNTLHGANKHNTNRWNQKWARQGTMTLYKCWKWSTQNEGNAQNHNTSRKMGGNRKQIKGRGSGTKNG